MGFFRQFDEFDPLAGKPNYHPFPQLQDIARLARTLPKGCTRDEIINGADTAEFLIEGYFSSEKDDRIRHLPGTGSWALKYLPEERQNEHGLLVLLDSSALKAEEDLSYVPTAESTSDLDALKESVGQWTLDDVRGFSNGRPFECFALSALWLVAVAVRWLAEASKVQSRARISLA